MNGYIPDCTNIGTTFVNSIANMLTCAAIDVKLEKVAQESEPLTDNDIKAMFGVLLVFQLIIAYFVFIA